MLHFTFTSAVTSHERNAFPVLALQACSSLHNEQETMKKDWNRGATIFMNFWAALTEEEEDPNPVLFMWCQQVEFMSEMKQFGDLDGLRFYNVPSNNDKHPVALTVLLVNTINTIWCTETIQMWLIFKNIWRVAITGNEAINSELDKLYYWNNESV